MLPQTLGWRIGILPSVVSDWLPSVLIMLPDLGSLKVVAPSSEKRRFGRQENSSSTPGLLTLPTKVWFVIRPVAGLISATVVENGLNSLRKAVAKTENSLVENLIPPSYCRAFVVTAAPVV